MNFVARFQRGYVLEGDKYIQQKKAMQMFALAGADLTIKFDTSASSTFSKLVTGIVNPTYSKLPRSVRSDVCEVVTIQEECFKKLEYIQAFLFATMPRELVTLIIDYVIPFYTVDGMEEDGQYVFETLNRSVAAEWKRIKNN